MKFDEMGQLIYESRNQNGDEKPSGYNTFKYDEKGRDTLMVRYSTSAGNSVPITVHKTRYQKGSPQEIFEVYGGVYKAIQNRYTKFKDSIYIQSKNQIYKDENGTEVKSVRYIFNYTDTERIVDTTFGITKTKYENNLLIQKGNFLYTYNTKGNLKRMTNTYDLGSTFSEFNLEGNSIRYCAADENGNCYNYDELGYLTSYLENYEVKKYAEYNKEDAYGNWTRMIVYVRRYMENDIVPVLIGEREITYYE